MVEISIIFNTTRMATSELTANRDATDFGILRRNNLPHHKPPQGYRSRLPLTDSHAPQIPGFVNSLASRNLERYPISKAGFLRDEQYATTY